VFACAAAHAAQGRELELTIGDLQAPGFSAQSLRAKLSGATLQALQLDIGKLTVAGRTFNKARLSCAETELTSERIACPRGVLEIGEKLPVSFSYLTNRRELTVESKTAAGETWRFSGRFDAKPAVLELKVEQARIDRLAPWLPPGVPKLTAGRASGTLTMRGDAMKAQVAVEGLAFADAAGLHAGEKLGAALEADAVGAAGEWRWNARLTWRIGEVFWQPVFMAAKGQRIELEGTTAGGLTRVRKGRLELPGMGAVAFSGEWKHAQGEPGAFEASAARVRVAALYEDVLKPLAAGTAVADMRAEGEASFSLKGAGKTLASADLVLHDVSFEDRQRRFALFGLSGRVPWRSDAAGIGELDLKGAEFLKIPVGRVRVPLRIRSNRVDAESVRVPVFDGAVHLRDFALGMAKDGWRWRFGGEVEAISMVQLSGAFGLPPMHGSLSGKIPELRYRRRMIEMDGALDIRVFDGIVSASKVQLLDPFGRAPRLHADIDVKNLDLELLTRTVDFGTITGRIDARIANLELVGWQPVRFDARIASSAGTYPRKISQRAVQNISALGGAGAAAAIQRSLLRFFDQFGYEKLGLSCKLENGVCEMDGIERAPQGYVIVKGGGIPAISVIGYNRTVDWREFVERLKRITQDNVKPIVK
jgi:hypothetical protein